MMKLYSLLLLIIALLLSNLADLHSNVGDTIKPNKDWEVDANCKFDFIKYSESNNYIILSELKGDSSTFFKILFAKNGETILSKTLLKSNHKSIRIIKDDSILLYQTESMKAFYLYSFPDYELKGVLPEASAKLSSFNLSEDENFIVAITERNTLVLWDIKKKEKTEKALAFTLDPARNIYYSTPYFITGANQLACQYNETYYRPDGYYSASYSYLSHTIYNFNLDSTNTILKGESQEHSKPNMGSFNKRFDYKIFASNNNNFYFLEHYKTISTDSGKNEKRKFFTIYKYSPKEEINAIMVDNLFDFTKNFIYFDDNKIYADNIDYGEKLYIKIVDINTLRLSNILDLSEVKKYDINKNHKEFIGINESKIIKFSINNENSANQNEEVNYLNINNSILNNNSNIQLVINSSALVRISICDALGQRFTTLVNQFYNVGKYNINLNEISLPIGLYFLKFNDSFSQKTYKMIINK